jgi:hypothetical protein
MVGVGQVDSAPSGPIPGRMMPTAVRSMALTSRLRELASLVGSLRRWAHRCAHLPRSAQLPKFDPLDARDRGLLRWAKSLPVVSQRFEQTAEFAPQAGAE